MPKPVKFVLWKISDLTLSVYLVSYIFDTRFYPKLNQAVPVMQDRLPYYFVIVPVVFLCSLLLSIVIEILAQGILKLVRYLPKGIEKLRTFRIFTPQNVTFGVLFLGALVFSLWKCRYGFGGDDEAFYLTIPHRYNLGDVPFRDEWHLSLLSGFLTMPFT